MNELLIKFQESLWFHKGLSALTLSAYLSDLRKLAVFLVEQDGSLVDAQPHQIQHYLDLQREQGVSIRSLARFLSCYRHFYEFLIQEEIRAENPAESIVLPKFQPALPESISEAIVDALLDAPDIESNIGLRDRAMLEILYSCGFRVTELITLTLSQINLKAGYIRILGKGNKERLVPVGEEAHLWLDTYLKASRGHLSKGRNNDVVFLSNRGDSMTRQAFWYIIKKYTTQIGVTTNISPHTLRHAFATHLVNHGAGLRVVQLLLGHSSLSTTQIYTQVAKERLKSIHQTHHPRG